jgi:KaiC/GvpD/RAD55 family RecA-like ATPase
MLEFTKVKTGIEGLDEPLGGGIPTRSLILILGDPGSGFDLFAQQILYNKANEDEKAVYLTIERAPVDIEEEMALFGWDLEALKKDKKWIFVDAYNLRLKHAGKTEIISMFDTDFIQQIKFNITHTVLDSLSYLLLNFNLRVVIGMVELLQAKVKSQGGVHFMLMVKGMHEPNVISTMEHMVDGVFEFTTRESVDGAQEKIVTIKKMRRAIIPKRIYSIRTSEKGLAVEAFGRV